MPYRPNKKMRDNATAALAHRKTLPPSRQFGTAVGLARARDIKNNVALSKRTINRMRSFLARHRANYEKQKRLPRKDRGKAYWSYQLWGGAAAIAWTNDKLRRYERAGE